jgi:hypothetical protein
MQHCHLTGQSACTFVRLGRVVASLGAVAALTWSVAARGQDGGSSVVHLEADRPGMQYLVRTRADAARYEPLCVAPCETTLPAGTYRMALSIPGVAAPAQVGDAVAVPGPATLRATYRSNAGHRITGWTLLGVGVAIGVRSLAWGLAQKEVDCGDNHQCGTGPNMGSVVVGIASIVVGLAVGLPLALKADQVQIEVEPYFQYAARAVLPAGGLDRAAPPADAPGLGVRGSF